MTLTPKQKHANKLIILFAEAALKWLTRGTVKDWELFEETGGMYEKVRQRFKLPKRRRK
jgi:hypothetical protein